MDSIHILVVDDNHINRLFFQAALKKLNCQVSTANDGFESLEKSQATRFDLILMDIRMDGMNGVEAASLIRQNTINQNTPIVAVSAEPINAEQRQHFCCSLLKPVSQQCLAQLLDELLTKTPAFNHQKALEISHHDENIVMHLRSLLIKQLIDCHHEITDLFAQGQFELLQDKLHQLLGSAKICAADSLSENITAFKQSLIEDPATATTAYNKLIKTIEQLIEYESAV